MIVLVLMMAVLAYAMVRVLRSRRGHRVTPPATEVDLQPMSETWGQMDELQLVRLLRDAAGGG